MGASDQRRTVERAWRDPSTFRDALLRVPESARDAWVDRELGLGELPADGPALPRDCVPYLPCGVDVILRIVEQVPVGPSDVFVDIGSGVGRATVLIHLLTGAEAIGIEVQPALVLAARDLAKRLTVPRVSTIEGDAAELVGFMTNGTVFFLYCPFSGIRLAKVIADLEPIARTRTIRVCCLDLPLPRCSWLALEPQLSADLAIYRSTS
jgi:SAM-dependent methyltransferase